MIKTIFVDILDKSNCAAYIKSEFHNNTFLRKVLVKNVVANLLGVVKRNVNSFKGTYHLWISRFDFFHFWYSKTTILSKNKNAFKFKKFNLKAEI